MKGHPTEKQKLTKAQRRAKQLLARHTLTKQQVEALKLLTQGDVHRYAGKNGIHPRVANNLIALGLVTEYRKWSERIYTLTDTGRAAAMALENEVR